MKETSKFQFMRLLTSSKAGVLEKILSTWCKPETLYQADTIHLYGYDKKK